MKNTHHQLKLAASITFLLAALGASGARAADVKPADEVSVNAGLTSDYRYRGISQSRLQPALQGGADYVNNPTGLYAGTWLSSVKWVKDLGGDGNVEMDIYGGKKGEIALVPGLSYDVGGLYYFYPSNALNPSANTFELYGQLGFGPAYIKYSGSTTNLFGTANSKNSGYLDIGANIEIATGLVLNLHAGRQEVKNNSAYSYTDYKIGVTRNFGICSVALAGFYTNTALYTSPAGKNLGKSGAVLSLSTTF